MTTPAPAARPTDDAHLGAYYGAALSMLDADALAIAHIDARLLAGEARLFQHKWFDYRMLHPTKATYLLAHCYNAGFRYFMMTCIDRGRRHMHGGFKGDDFLQTREAKSFWRLRQRIDELGMPYDLFMRHAMDWHIAAGWRQPPRPAHLAANDELMIVAANAWSEHRRARIPFAASPRYTAARFVGAPDQLAYEDLIVDAILRRPHPKFGLHAALYLCDALRIETAIARMPDDAILAAIAEAG